MAANMEYFLQGDMEIGSAKRTVWQLPTEAGSIALRK